MNRHFLNFTFLVLLFSLCIFITYSNAQDNQSYKFSNLKLNNKPTLQGINDPYWITYFGGSNDDIFSCTMLDNKNNIISVGTSYSYNLPTNSNSYQKNKKGSNDIYVAKFDFKGNLLWSTYIGGSGWEYVFRIGIDKFNRIWIVGESQSSNYPITDNPFPFTGGYNNGVITCFDENGDLVYSALIGGDGYDAFLDLAIDDTDIYVIGRTGSSDYPVSSDAFQKSKLGGYNGVIVRVNLTTFKAFSSFLGVGSNSNLWLESIALDKSNNIILGGFTNENNFPFTNSKLDKNFKGDWDIWLMKFDKNFNLMWSNLYGGSLTDKITVIRTDNLNNIYCLGFTNSPDIQLASPLENTLSGGFDALIFKLNSSGEMIWSTYIGGSGDESYGLNNQITDRFVGDLFLDSIDHRIAVNFRTSSSNIYTTSDAFQSKYQGGSYDSYSLILNYDEEPQYATFFGGNDTEMSSSIFLKDTLLIISGMTSSSNIPVTSNAFQKNINTGPDAFIAVFGINLPAPPPTDSIPPTITGTLDSCSIFRTISVKDDQISTSGLKDINIIQSDNCDISITNKTQTTATILIRLIDYEKNGYYTIEIIDNAGNKTIIKDMLHSTGSNYISFTPRPLYDFGKVKFGQTICRDIMIHNSSAKDVEIKDIMIAKNLDFSIPQSQYPIVVPALDSVGIQVCFSAKYPLYGMYRDTLTYFENCVFAQTALVAEIDSATYDGKSRCEVVIKIRSNYDSLGDSEPLIYPNPTRGIVWINSNNSRDDLSLEVYNILGEQVKSMQIEAKSLPKQIDLRDMNDGNYVIIIHQNNLLSVKKILLLQ